MVDSVEQRSEISELTDEECRAQLARIVQSNDFDATTRERRFLQYVVEETLAGRAARIKAYSIATEVFEREDSFDPQNDPIVRIEASRLRRALERYYLTAGAFDAIVIDIPKGGYVPVFSVRRVPLRPPALSDVPATVPQEPGAVRANRHDRKPWVLAAACVGVCLLVCAYLFGPFGTHDLMAVRSKVPELPRLHVVRFEDLGGTDASQDIATGLTQEIIGQLSRFKDISVIATDVETPTPDTFLLRGSVSLASNAFRLRVQLLRRADGAVLWADSYSGPLSTDSMIATQIEIADRVAATLAQVDGVIFQASRFPQVAHNVSWEAYSCTLSFHAFRTTLDYSMLGDVRACLERTVAAFPDYSTGWALLALSEMDRLRTQLPFDEAVNDEITERALRHARRAIALDPQNARALQAEMLVLFYKGHFAEARQVGERALALNPNDAELLGEFGYRLAMSGDWEGGCTLLRDANTKRPMPSAYQHTGLGLCAYFEGGYENALAVLGRMSTESHPLTMLIAAASCGEVGDAEGAEAIRDLLRQTAPSMLQNARAEVAARLGRPEDVERFMRSLVQAGFTDSVGLDAL